MLTHSVHRGPCPHPPASSSSGSRRATPSRGASRRALSPAAVPRASPPVFRTEVPPRPGRRPTRAGANTASRAGRSSGPGSTAWPTRGHPPLCPGRRLVRGGDARVWPRCTRGLCRTPWRRSALGIPVSGRLRTPRSAAAGLHSGRRAARLRPPARRAGLGRPPLPRFAYSRATGPSPSPKPSRRSRGGMPDACGSSSGAILKSPASGGKGIRC